MSHAADVLTRPSGSRKAGGRAGPRRCATRRSSAAKASASRTGFVKNEPALTDVRVGGVDDHALAAAQREHRLADGGERGAVADLDAQRPRELGVADRRRALRALEDERTASTTQRPGVRLNALER